MAVVSEQAEWLGSPESAHLEYKSGAALDRPETIVRAVVALLNHRGGYVVVGVDNEGKPDGLCSKRNPGRERDRLQSMLVDTIEPRPVDHVEVRARTVLGVDVLEISVSRPSTRTGTIPLYAERRHGLYGFWVRSGATTRAYTLEEVRRRFTDGAIGRAPARWDAALVRNDESEIVFVLQAELAPGDTLERAAIDRVLATEARPALYRRPMSWAVVDEYDRVETGARRLLTIGSAGGRKWLSFDFKAGVIRFEGRADYLRWKRHPLFGDRIIYPFPLVEGTASFFWLLARYGVEAGARGTVHCQLGLWRPEGWRLGPGGPGTIAWESPNLWMPPHDNTSIEYAADLPWEELRGNADRVARSFIAEVYGDFGYDESAIPFWINDTQRFAFE